MATKTSVINIELPDGYSPYPKMIICGNSFDEGKVPIAIDGKPLFLVGQGRNVWLMLNIGDNEWEFVVTPDEITDSAIDVTISRRKINIYFGSHRLLRAQEKSDTLLDIDHLDFRPLGISIFGNSLGLTVGRAQISKNKFKQVHTMVNVVGATD